LLNRIGMISTYCGSECPAAGRLDQTPSEPSLSRDLEQPRRYWGPSETRYELILSQSTKSKRENVALDVTNTDTNFIKWLIQTFWA
jgi:hypothetical protein